jgi:hypothetical protein
MSDNFPGILPNSQAIKEFADVMDAIDNIPGFFEYLGDQFEKHGYARSLVNKIPGPMRGLLGIANVLLDATQFTAMTTLAAQGDGAGALEILIDKVGVKLIATAAAGWAGGAAAGATFWSGPIAFGGGIVVGTLTYNAIERGLGYFLDDAANPENREAINKILEGNFEINASTPEERMAHGREVYALIPKNFVAEDDRLTNLGRLKAQIELAERAGMKDRADSLRGEFNDSLEVFYLQGGNIDYIRKVVSNDPNANQQLAISFVAKILPDDLASARAALRHTSDAGAKQLMQMQVGLLEAEAQLRADPGNREVRAQQAQIMESRDYLIARLAEDPNALDGTLKDLEHAVGMQNPDYAQRVEADNIANLAPVSKKAFTPSNPYLKEVVRIRREAWAAGERGDMAAYRQGEDAAEAKALEYLQSGGTIAKASREFGYLGNVIEGEDINGKGGALNELNKNAAAIRAMDINRDNKISIGELGAGLYNYGVTMKADQNNDFTLSADEIMARIPEGAVAPRAQRGGR